MQSLDSKPCEISKENRAREEVVREFQSYLMALNRSENTEQGIR